MLLGIGLLYDPRAVRVLDFESPLYGPHRARERYRGYSKVRTPTARRKVLIDLP